MTMPPELFTIRLVTERYYELQGLRRALIGTSVLTGVVVYVVLTLGGISAGLAAAVAILVAMLIVLPGMFWLDRYYASRFGRIIPSPANRRFGMLIVPGALMLAMVVERVALLPVWSLYFGVWAVIASWIAVRDWPARNHHLVEAAAGVVCAAIQWRSRVPQDGAGAPDVLALILLAAALSLSGFMDHQLLAHTMTARALPAEETAQEAHGRGDAL
jgi:hypothetical protein